MWTLSDAAPRFDQVDSTPGVSSVCFRASSRCANPIVALYQHRSTVASDDSGYASRRSIVVTALNPIIRRRYGVDSVRTAT